MSSTTTDPSSISSPDDDFQPSEVFTNALMEQIHKQDVVSMVKTQREMLGRYEKTNEMLINFNMLSSARFAVTNQEFQKHTQVMFEMRKDLDVIFKRIRTLKQRLGKMYPEAFSVCSDVYNVVEEDQEHPVEDQSSEVTSQKPVPAASSTEKNNQELDETSSQTSLNQSQPEHSSSESKDNRTKDMKSTNSLPDS